MREGAGAAGGVMRPLEEITPTLAFAAMLLALWLPVAGALR